MTRVVIVGAGPVAHRFATLLRAGGHTGELVLLGAERHRPYNRALLGSVLDGSLQPEALQLPESGAQVRTSTVVTSIDRARRLVRTRGGGVLGYDVLVLATGARPRLPHIPGLPPRRLRAMRAVEDCSGAAPGPVAVLGGGVLGVQTARALQARGVEVCLVHRGTGTMSRQLGHDGGGVLTQRLRDSGMDVRAECIAVGWHEGFLDLSDGSRVAAHQVLACAGIEPEAELAAEAGLDVGRGVVVDDRLCTADPSVHAIGDCAEHEGRAAGQLAAGWEQAEVLAEVLAGSDRRYRPRAPVVRLQDREWDVLGVGTPGEGLVGRVVALSDPDRGRHARLELDGDHLRSAAVVGFGAAIATLAELHTRGRALPADRLSLLLGEPPRRGAAPAAADAVVCHCNTVTRSQLLSEMRGGASTVRELAARTRATTGCGGCREEVAALCTAAIADQSESLLEDKEGAA